MAILMKQSARRSRFVKAPFYKSFCLDHKLDGVAFSNHPLLVPQNPSISLGPSISQNLSISSLCLQASIMLHKLQRELIETKVEIERHGQAVTTTDRAKIRRLEQDINKSKLSQDSYENIFTFLREQESKDLCGIDTFSQSTVNDQRSNINSPTHLSHLDASFFTEDNPIDSDVSPSDEVNTYNASEDYPPAQDAHISTNVMGKTLVNILVTEPQTKSFCEKNSENMAPDQRPTHDAWFSKLSSLTSFACRRAASTALTVYEAVEKEAIQLIDPVHDATAADERLEPDFTDTPSIQPSRLLTQRSQSADKQVVDLEMYNEFSSVQAREDLSSIPEVGFEYANCGRGKVCLPFSFMFMMGSILPRQNRQLKKQRALAPRNQ